MNRITLAHLKGACADQRALFRKTFPKGAPVTAEAMAKAQAAELDVFWLARILPAPARAEYNRATVPAQAEYDRATVPAWAEYNRVMASARAEYNRVKASALAEYNRVMASARAEYDRIRASALLAALLSINEEV